MNLKHNALNITALDYNCLHKPDKYLTNLSIAELKLVTGVYKYAAIRNNCVRNKRRLLYIATLPTENWDSTFLSYLREVRHALQVW